MVFSIKTCSYQYSTYATRNNMFSSNLRLQTSLTHPLTNWLYASRPLRALNSLAVIKLACSTKYETMSAASSGGKQSANSPLARALKGSNPLIISNFFLYRSLASLERLSAYGDRSPILHCTDTTTRARTKQPSLRFFHSPRCSLPL